MQLMKDLKAQFERFFNLARGPLPLPELATPSAKMLYALECSGKPVYAGTVPATTVAKRRAANKVARRQRKVNAR